MVSVMRAFDAVVATPFGGIGVRVAEGSTDWPALAATFYEQVRRPHVERLAAYLARRRDAGLLPIGDADVAANVIYEQGKRLAAAGQLADAHEAMLEVETRQPRLASEAGMLADKIMQNLGAAGKSPSSQHYVPQRAAAVDPKRPNYLDKIKAFALGE